MFNNYEYFIALAEEENISRAAEKLFISHQCLSKYLKNLEENYHVMFFDRQPKLKLTPAGEAVAKRIYERHTVLTKLFIDIGVSEKTASEDACRIEHYISDETFDAVKAAIKKPT